MKLRDIIDGKVRYREPDATPVDYQGITLWVRPSFNHQYQLRAAELSDLDRSAGDERGAVDGLIGYYDLIASTVLVDWSGWEDGEEYTPELGVAFLRAREDAMNLVLKTAKDASKRRQKEIEDEQGNSDESSDELFDESLTTTTESLKPTE